MIKSNRQSEESILKSGYRNRLREYGENSELSRVSGDSKGVTQKSRGQLFRHVNDNEVNKRHSGYSRKSSIQRAFNSRVGVKDESKIVQAQSQVQPFLSIEKDYELRHLNQGHLSQVVGLERSGSEVMSQIERLSRLREEYEILRQVSSDIEYQQNVVNASTIHNQLQQTHRRYIYQSGDSFPLQVIKNRKISKNQKDKGNRNQKVKRNEQVKRNQKDMSNTVQKSLNKHIKQLNNNNKSNWNPQKEQNILSSEQQEQNSDNQHSAEEQEIRPVTSSKHSNRIISQEKNKIDKSLHVSYEKYLNPTTQQELMLQISSLQSALTQSSLKIEELLIEKIKTKQKLQQHQQNLQKNHKLQNQLKLSKETEKFLKRQIQLKEDEINRFQKRTKLMKETIQMLEKETQLKDNQIKALENLIQNYRNKFTPTTLSNNSILNSNDYEQVDKQHLRRIRLLSQENESLKAQLQEERKRTDFQRQNLKKSTVEGTLHIKSYYTQFNNHLKEQLEKSQQELYTLRGQNRKLLSELEQQHSKHTEMRQTISNKEQEILALSQSQGHINESRLGRQIEGIERQISKLQHSSQTNQHFSQANQLSYINALQLKLRQLEEIIKSQNNQKQQFVHEIQKFRNQQKKLIQDKNILEKENSQLKKEIHQLRKEIHQIGREMHQLKIENTQQKTQLKFIQQDNNKSKTEIKELKENSVSREQFSYVEREKIRVSNQLEKVQRTSFNSQEDQQLLTNLNSIKQEYLKLEEVYFEKARETQTIKSQLLKNTQQIHFLESQIQLLERQIRQEREYSAELQRKFQEKEMQMVELVNIAQTHSTYTNMINQLQQKVTGLEMKIKEKDFLLNQFQIQNKKSMNEEKLTENQLKLQLSQLKVQSLNLKTSYQQQFKQLSQQIQNCQKQIQLKNDELIQQERHYNQINKIDKQMMEKQLKMLQNQLFQIIMEKQKLMEQTMKIAQLQHQLKSLGLKQRNSRKITESIDHLWMIKEAEYWNVNQILTMFTKIKQ